MKLTNKMGLPDAIVRYAERRVYDRGAAKFSATDLLKSPRQFWLIERHDDEITVDVADLFWALLGTAAHSILQVSAAEHTLSEERLFGKIALTPDSEPIVFSGQMDNWDDGHLTDWKVTSVWSAIYGTRHADWTKQGNIYAFLMRKYGFIVDSVSVTAIYRDWKWRDMQTRPLGEYPPPMEMVKLPLWTDAEVEQFLRTRIGLMVAAEGLSDDSLPLCTSDFMWEKPTTYAVIKKGGKRAQRVLPTMVEAERWKFEAAQTPDIKKKREADKMEIHVRPGERTRCAEYYCDAAPFCNQYQTWKKAKEAMENEARARKEQAEADAKGGQATVLDPLLPNPNGDLDIEDRAVQTEGEYDL